MRTFELGRGLLAPLEVTRAQNEAGSGLRKSLRDLPTEPGTSAGDDRVAPRQVEKVGKAHRRTIDAVSR